MKQLIPMDDLVHSALDICSKDLNEALCLVDKAFNDIDAPWVEHCVRETIMRWNELSACTERDVYRWFKLNYKKYLGENWSICHKNNDRRHIPDFWLMVNKKYIPVECKLHDFNNKALQQLQRYMEFYKCSCGVAVGKECSIALPSNIIFLQYDMSEVAYD